MKHIPFPSIERFRHIVKEIGFHAAYTGKDATGEPIYDFTRPLPSIHFRGTVKLHGTNAGVTWNAIDGIYAQSREQVITVENDNAGFARFVQENHDSFRDLFLRIVADNNVLPNWYVSIFGEWAGKGIMKKMAINNVDKSFYIFGVKITNPNDIEDHKWVPFEVYQDPLHRIYNITNFTTYGVDVDFANPEASVEVLEKMIADVEAECPVAAAFGHKGLGEGIVFTGEWNGKNYRFKAKGEKHETVNIKDKISIAPKLVASYTAFAEYAVGDGRMEQAYSAVCSDGRPTIQQTGAVIKWVCQDVLKEEADVLKANGFEWKDVQGYVSAQARKLFMKKVDM